MKVSSEGLQRHAALFFAMMASGGNNIVLREVWVVLTCVTCLSLLRWRIPLRTSRNLIYIWLILLVVLLFFLQGLSSIVSIASRMLTFVAAIMLVEVYLSRSLDRLKSDLFNILSLMSVQAILTSFLGNLVDGLFWTVNVNGRDYLTLFYLFNFHYVHEEVARYVRPDGFFYEPGVFQIYLSIFLYLCLFWRFSMYWVAAALVALVTVWSTIGLGIAAALLVLSSWRLLSHLRGMKLVLLLAAYVAMLPVAVTLTMNNYNEKVTGELRGSFLARQYDLYTGMNVIKEKPLTGIGFGLDAYLRFNLTAGYQASELAVEQTNDRPNSNGLVQVLYTIGIPLGLPLLLGMATQRLFRPRLPMAILLAWSFYGQSLVFTPFFLFILLSGFIFGPNVVNKLRTPQT